MRAYELLSLDANDIVLQKCHFVPSYRTVINGCPNSCFFWGGEGQCVWPFIGCFYVKELLIMYRKLKAMFNM